MTSLLKYQLQDFEYLSFQLYNIHSYFALLYFIKYLSFRYSGFIRILRIIAPFEPATIINRYTRPAHKPGIKPCFTTPPSCTTIKGKMFVRSNTSFNPDIRGLTVFPYCKIKVPVVFHMIGITSAIGKDCSGNASLGFYIVISAYLSNILCPASDTNEFCIL